MKGAATPLGTAEIAALIQGNVLIVFLLVVSLQGSDKGKRIVLNIHLFQHVKYLIYPLLFFIHSTNRLAKQTVELATFYRRTFTIRLFPFECYKFDVKLLPCV